MKAFKKSLLELGRVVLLSVIPVVMSSINVVTGEFKLNGAVLLAVGVLAALKWLDKLLHEVGKENKSDALTKGLVRF